MLCIFTKNDMILLFDVSIDKIIHILYNFYCNTACYLLPFIQNDETERQAEIIRLFVDKDLETFMRGRRKTVKISEAEWNIMKVLWDGCKTNSRGMTLGEIVSNLSEATGWSDTTIRTLIIRLAEKGAVSIDKTTGVYKYKPISSKDESVLRETESFVERVFDGSYPALVSTIAASGKISDSEKEKIISALMQ